jgi:hypothetical protein
VLKAIKTFIPSDLVILLSESKELIQNKEKHGMSKYVIATLLTVVSNQKQLKCPTIRK